MPLHEFISFTPAVRSAFLQCSSLEEFTAAVRLDPEYANAQFNLGAALANSGRREEAVEHFSEALRIQPDFRRARESLEAVSARLRTH